MNTTNQIADALENSGIPFTRVEGIADGIEYWGLSVYHENIHVEVRECSKWVEMKVFNFTPEQFMRMLVGEHSATRINVPRKDHLSMGHYECGACGAVIGYNNRYCHRCGARLVDDD